MGQLQEHLSSHHFAIELFRAHFFVYFGAQLVHLLDELGAQFLVGHRLKRLKLALLFNWSDQSRAVSVREDLLDQSADAIFVFNGV